MRRTTRGLVTTLGLGVVLTGCSHSTPPPRIDSADASASGSATTATTSTGGATAGGPIAGAVLAARVRAAMAKAGSARFALQSSKTSGPDATGVLAIHGTVGQRPVRLHRRHRQAPGDRGARRSCTPMSARSSTAGTGSRSRAGGTDPLSSAMAPLLSYMTNSADVSSQTTSWSAAGGFTPSGPTDVGRRPSDGVRRDDPARRRPGRAARPVPGHHAQGHHRRQPPAGLARRRGPPGQGRDVRQLRRQAGPGDRDVRATGVARRRSPRRRRRTSSRRTPEPRRPLGRRRAVGRLCGKRAHAA